MQQEEVSMNFPSTNPQQSQSVTKALLSSEEYDVAVEFLREEREFTSGFISKNLNCVLYANGIYFGRLGTSGLPEGQGLVLFNDLSLFAGVLEKGKIKGQGVHVAFEGGLLFGSFYEGKLGGPAMVSGLHPSFFRLEEIREKINRFLSSATNSKFTKVIKEMGGKGVGLFDPDVGRGSLLVSLEQAASLPISVLGNSMIAAFLASGQALNESEESPRVVVSSNRVKACVQGDNESWFGVVAGKGETRLGFFQGQIAQGFGWLSVAGQTRVGFFEQGREERNFLVIDQKGFRFAAFEGGIEGTTFLTGKTFNVRRLFNLAVAFLINKITGFFISATDRRLFLSLTGSNDSRASEPGENEVINYFLDRFTGEPIKAGQSSSGRSLRAASRLARDLLDVIHQGPLPYPSSSDQPQSVKLKSEFKIQASQSQKSEEDPKIEQVSSPTLRELTDFFVAAQSHGPKNREHELVSTILVTQPRQSKSITRSVERNFSQVYTKSPEVQSPLVKTSSRFSEDSLSGKLRNLDIRQSFNMTAIKVRNSTDPSITSQAKFKLKTSLAIEDLSYPELVFKKKENSSINPASNPTPVSFSENVKNTQNLPAGSNSPNSEIPSHMQNLFLPIYTSNASIIRSTLKDPISTNTPSSLLPNYKPNAALVKENLISPTTIPNNNLSKLDDSSPTELISSSPNEPLVINIQNQPITSMSPDEVTVRSSQYQPRPNYNSDLPATNKEQHFSLANKDQSKSTPSDTQNDSMTKPTVKDSFNNKGQPETSEKFLFEVSSPKKGKVSIRPLQSKVTQTPKESDSGKGVPPPQPGLLEPRQDGQSGPALSRRDFENTLAHNIDAFNIVKNTNIPLVNERELKAYNDDSRLFGLRKSNATDLPSGLSQFPSKDPLQMMQKNSVKSPLSSSTNTLLQTSAQSQIPISAPEYVKEKEDARFSQLKMGDLDDLPDFATERNPGNDPIDDLNDLPDFNTRLSSSANKPLIETEDLLQSFRDSEPPGSGPEKRDQRQFSFKDQSMKIDPSHFGYF